MYIRITNIDAGTGVLCTDAPMRTGPTLPNVKGFVYQWETESIYPIDCAPDGTYLEMPLYYGTCDDDADTSLVGVVDVLTEEQYNAYKLAELEARKLLGIK